MVSTLDSRWRDFCFSILKSFIHSGFRHSIHVCTAETRLNICLLNEMHSSFLKSACGQLSIKE